MPFVKVRSRFTSRIRTIQSSGLPAYGKLPLPSPFMYISCPTGITLTKRVSVSKGIALEDNASGPLDFGEEGGGTKFEKPPKPPLDRKSTRLNSSHVALS